MIVVRLAEATEEQLRRLANTNRWYMGPAMLLAIRREEVTITAVEAFAETPHVVEVRVDPYLPAGVIVGWERDPWHEEPPVLTIEPIWDRDHFVTDGDDLKYRLLYRATLDGMTVEGGDSPS